MLNIQFTTLHAVAEHKLLNTKNQTTESSVENYEQSKMSQCKCVSESEEDNLKNALKTVTILWDKNMCKTHTRKNLKGENCSCRQNRRDSTSKSSRSSLIIQYRVSLDTQFN